jgi:hypothetical protein
MPIMPEMTVDRDRPKSRETREYGRRNHLNSWLNGELTEYNRMQSRPKLIRIIEDFENQLSDKE